MLNALAPQKPNRFFMGANRFGRPGTTTAATSTPMQGRMSVMHGANARKGKKARKHMASKPKGAHGRAAVRALGRTKTTGNFKKIEKAKGKGAAIGAYQNALAKHQGRTAPYGGKKKAKKYAHKGHTHMSRKAMKAC